MLYFLALTLFLPSTAAAASETIFKGLELEPAAVLEVGNELWVRNDYEIRPRATAAVAVLGSDGSLRKQASPSDLGLQRLMDFAFDGTHVWLLDAQGWLLAVDRELRVIERRPLQGEHPFPRYADSLAIDPQGLRFWIAGCHPLRTYLDQGCLELHEYQGTDLRHVRSALETSPYGNSLEEQPALDVKLVRISPGGARWVVFSSWYRALGWVQPNGSQNWRPLDWEQWLPPFPRRPKSGAGAEFFERLLKIVGIYFPEGEKAVIVAYDPPKQRSILTGFDPSGKALWQRELPGRVVGFERGGWKIAHRVGRDVVIRTVATLP